MAADFLLRRGGERKSNVKTLRVGPITKAGVYLAFQAQGVCMALLAVRVYIKKCPSIVRNFSAFPETLPHSLVQQAQGECVENSAPSGPDARPPTMLCGEDGQWVEPASTSCACKAGYEPVDTDRCRGECARMRVCVLRKKRRKKNKERTPVPVVFLMFYTLMEIGYCNSTVPTHTHTQCV